MAIKITDLNGITPEVAAKLTERRPCRWRRFLAAVADTGAAAQALAAQLQVEPRLLLELGNRADLARIKGIGVVYSDLLEYAGVDTVVELAQRNPENLYAKLVEVAGQHFVERLPRPADVTGWIEQATSMERVLQY